MRCSTGQIWEHLWMLSFFFQSSNISSDLSLLSDKEFSSLTFFTFSLFSSDSYADCMRVDISFQITCCFTFASFILHYFGPLGLTERKFQLFVAGLPIIILLVMIIFCSSLCFNLPFYFCIYLSLHCINFVIANNNFKIRGGCLDKTNEAQSPINN